MNLLLPFLFLWFVLSFYAERTHREQRDEETHRLDELNLLRLELEEVRRELQLIREPFEKSKLETDEYLERNR